MSECEDHDNDYEITCLHTALICSFISERSREDIVKIMCGFVPEKMFTITDIKGRIPLHLAVEYGRCCKTQVGIVDELLRRGPKALEVEIRTFSHRPISVYQYHKNSRKQAESKKMKVGSQKNVTSQANVKEENDERRKANDPRKVNDPELDSKKAGLMADKRIMGQPPLPPPNKGRAKQPILGIRRSASSLVLSITQDDQDPTSSFESRQAGFFTAESELLGYTQNAIDLLRQKDEERDQGAEVIGEKLKLFYLCTQRPDFVSHCLRIQDEKGT